MIASFVLAVAVACENLVCTDYEKLYTAVRNCISDNGTDACGSEIIQSWDVKQLTYYGGLFADLRFSVLNLRNWGNQIGNPSDFTLFFAYKGETVEGLEDFDVSEVTNMGSLFRESNVKNCDISTWNTSNLIKMDYMFQNSQFNGDILGWDISKVTDFEKMFLNPLIRQDFSSWPARGYSGDELREYYGFGNDYAAGCLPGSGDDPCPYTPALAPTAATVATPAKEETEDSNETLYIVLGVCGGILLLTAAFKLRKRSGTDVLLQSIL